VGGLVDVGCNPYDGRRPSSKLACYVLYLQICRQSVSEVDAKSDKLLGVQRFLSKGINPGHALTDDQRVDVVVSS
jgi:hypothetical protein